MNLGQVKKRLKEISQSTGTKHPKTLIAELCGVIQSLIEVIEELKMPKITLTSDQTVPIDTQQITIIPKERPQEEEEGPTEKPGPGQRSRGPRRTPPLIRPNRTSPFNAGDAE